MKLRFVSSWASSAAAELARHARGYARDGYDDLACTRVYTICFVCLLSFLVNAGFKICWRFFFEDLYVCLIINYIGSRKNLNNVVSQYIIA